MPVLDWIGKQAVVKHHRDVPYRLLEPVPELSCGDADSGNLIVQGDNLLALKALLPRYAGQVKCVYIDPPYNTGNEGWAYNDNVNSPEIKKWLGEVVGKDGETLDRHDRWLCMMYPRLVLLKQFLREDGAIFVSIDDNEVATLRLLMDEIFGVRNFVGCFIQKRRDVADNRNVNGVSADHEYAVCYQAGSALRLQGAKKDTDKYSDPDGDPRGPWMSDNLTGLADANERPNLHYSITDPETENSYPPHPRRGWAVSRDTMERFIEEKRILWPKRVSGRPRIKRYLRELTSDTTGFSTVLTTPRNIAGTRELAKVFGDKMYAFPNPVDLVRELIHQSTSADSLILDSFAGSGTTGHAVLKQNAEDGGNRRFILVEMDSRIARDVTAERVKRVAQGYTNAKGERVEGLSGGFQFCTLSNEPLFTAEGQVRGDVTFAQLAEFVWFVETGSGFAGKTDSPQIGIHEGRAVYLLYNGILKDKSVAGGNVLTPAVLDVLPPFDGPRVIYAAACRLGTARLAREGIVFKQTPYALEG
jgi:site-specific DNA-methyltransferase (adenine-specific)/adenine-specific DNA-methyltransferase